MWLVSLRDLQFRARRFVIAILVTSLVFGIARAIDGMRRSVEDESPAIVALFGGTSGSSPRHHDPFTTTSVFDSSLQDDVPRRAGREAGRRRRPEPRRGVGSAGEGRQPHRPRARRPRQPAHQRGRAAKASGEAVVSPGISRLGRGPPGGRGDVVPRGREDLGRPVLLSRAVFLPLEDAQEIVFKVYRSRWRSQSRTLARRRGSDFLSPTTRWSATSNVPSPAASSRSSSWPC